MFIDGIELSVLYVNTNGVPGNFGAGFRGLRSGSIVPAPPCQNEELREDVEVRLRARENITGEPGNLGVGSFTWGPWAPCLPPSRMRSCARGSLYVGAFTSYVSYLYVGAPSFQLYLLLPFTLFFSRLALVGG